jgi:hypothetical protein
MSNSPEFDKVLDEFTASSLSLPDAKITVSIGAKSVTFRLDGDELSVGGEGHKYLSNASQHFIASRIEAALIEMSN